MIFILEVSSVEEAKTSLEKLPFVAMNMLDFDLIPIDPLMPLGTLLPDF